MQARNRKVAIFETSKTKFVIDFVPIKLYNNIIDWHGWEEIE
jgi:hypothetical protein